MRTWLLVLVGACSSDPTLTVSVAHPAGYGLAQTVVTAYDGTSLSCDQVRMGDRTAAELAAFTTDETDAASGSISLARLGDKVVVARGYTASQQLATAGCQDVGELTGDTHVDLETEPAAVVAIDPDQADRPFSERKIAVTMADILGAPLEGNVGWQMYGPAGVAVPDTMQGLATTHGAVVLPIADLGVAGPEAARVRAPWTTATLPLLSAFDLTGGTTLGFGGTALTAVPACAIRGHAGKAATAVCLSGFTNLQQHRDLVELSWNGSAFVTATRSVPGNGSLQAVFVDHDGSADEPTYAIGSDAAGNGTWYRMGDASASGVTLDPRRLPEHGVHPEVRRRQCPRRGVVRRPGRRQLGAAVQRRRPGQRAGRADQPRVRRLRVRRRRRRASGDRGRGGGGRPRDVRADRHAAEPGDRDQEERRHRLHPDRDRRAPVRGHAPGGAGHGGVRGRARPDRQLVQPRRARGARVGGAAGTIIGGRVDTDAATDLLWDISVPLTRRKLFQVSLGKQVLGAPLTAITSGPSSTGLNDSVGFVVGDLNGKGADEVVLFTANGATIYSPDH